MTTKSYKGYTIHITGLSHHIYHPGMATTPDVYAPGYAQSFTAAKRWINDDISRQEATQDFSLITFKGRTQCG